MSLDEWSQKLRERFDRLACREGAPVFALEHGLQDAEIDELRSAVRTQILAAKLQDEHWLAWAVYAAEVGYSYEGSEYWQSFEAVTPGWRDKGNRDYIRCSFKKFAQEFTGAEPTGTWAKQFTIISWPITHAILPRDLQGKLARALYDLRAQIYGETLENTKALGTLIQGQAQAGGSRFQEFAGSTALVGQIAAALLQPQGHDCKQLLDPASLDRIVRDLERVAEQKEWLDKARRSVRDGFHIRGLRVGEAPRTDLRDEKEGHAEVKRWSIEPQLVLGPPSERGWRAALEIPDLSHLLVFRDFEPILSEARCTVLGSDMRPRAGGYFLNRSQRVPLVCWPPSGQPLLKFHDMVGRLDFLLRTECMIGPGPAWLFKIASDKLAYQLRGMRARAGSSYIFVTTGNLPETRCAKTVNIQCAGVNALLLELPAALTPEWEAELEQLQIKQETSMEVWPAGLGAVVWDGEGRAEWFESEAMIVGLQVDHAMDKLTITGGGQKVEVDRLLEGEPIFVELPRLPAGRHEFKFAACSRAGVSVAGELEVVVRKSAPMEPVVRGSLEVDLVPGQPSLEQLWEGRANISVRGPAGHKVACNVQLRDRCDKILHEQELQFDLPVLPEDWEKKFKEIKNAQHESYDATRRCSIRFWADELGCFTLTCERESAPIQWRAKVARRDEAYQVGLVDDDGGAVPRVERYAFQLPTKPVTVEHAEVCRMLNGDQYCAPSEGGLYVATREDFKTAIVIPRKVQSKDLAALRLEPKSEVAVPSTVELERLVGCADLWTRARLSGDLLGRPDRLTVLQWIPSAIMRVLSGTKWPDLESAWINKLKQPAPSNTEQRRELKAVLGGHPMLAREDPEAILRCIYDERRKLVKMPRKALVERLPTSGTEWEVEFALRLVSAPGTIKAWALTKCNEHLETLFVSPRLRLMVQVARLGVLCVETATEDGDPARDVETGWGWPT